MITDPALRWALSALLAATAAASVYALTRRGVGGYQRMGHLLHAVMAVAMIVMAFPRGMELPTTAPMIFFIVASLWFLGVCLVARTGLLVNGYHAAMMAAMAWMYAVMDGSLLPGTTAHGDHSMSMPTSTGSGGAHSHHSSMSGHGADMAATGWVGGVNTVLVVAFGVAAAWWLYRYVAARQSDTPPTSITDHALFLGQVVMAAAMAVMFAAM